MLEQTVESDQVFSDEIMDRLRRLTEARLTFNAPLSRFTASRIGGQADILVEVSSPEDLGVLVMYLWQYDLPYRIIGGGSNILISDEGIRGVVLLNRATGHSGVLFSRRDKSIVVKAEAGVNFGLLARLAGERGYSGLEWAAGIPGTLGGAVIGNAGAFGGDIAGNLVVADILHRINQKGISIRESWTIEQMDYTYRNSRLKGCWDKAVILSAELRLSTSTVDLVKAQMEQFAEKRRKTQPPGASMGSMFKNPAGDYAGRLIEAAGFKGFQVGGAMISPLHANFFLNLGDATAKDVHMLLAAVHQAVMEKYAIDLELEVELIGQFPTW